MIPIQLEAGHLSEIYWDAVRHGLIEKQQVYNIKQSQPPSPDWVVLNLPYPLAVQWIKIAMYFRCG